MTALLIKVNIDWEIDKCKELKIAILSGTEEEAPMKKRLGKARFKLSVAINDAVVYAGRRKKNREARTDAVVQFCSLALFEVSNAYGYHTIVNSAKVSSTYANMVVFLVALAAITVSLGWVLVRYCGAGVALWRSTDTPPELSLAVKIARAYLDSTRLDDVFPPDCTAETGKEVARNELAQNTEEGTISTPPAADGESARAEEASNVDTAVDVDAERSGDGHSPVPHPPHVKTGSNAAAEADINLFRRSRQEK